MQPFLEVNIVDKRQKGVGESIIYFLSVHINKKENKKRNRVDIQTEKQASSQADMLIGVTAPVCKGIFQERAMVQYIFLFIFV